jgi:hypothetical protein
MKKVFGNGRTLAAAILAVGMAAIAVPAFGASSGSGGSSSSVSGSPAPSGGRLPPFPPPPALSGATSKKVEQTAQCMKDHGIAPPDPSQGSSSTPKPPSPSEFRDAAKACGLPTPPDGALPPPMGAPGAPGTLDGAAVQRCLHAQSQNRQR